MTQRCDHNELMENQVAMNKSIVFRLGKNKGKKIKRQRENVVTYEGGEKCLNESCLSSATTVAITRSLFVFQMYRYGLNPHRHKAWPLFIHIFRLIGEALVINKIIGVT